MEISAFSIAVLTVTLELALWLLAILADKLRVFDDSKFKQDIALTAFLGISTGFIGLMFVPIGYFFNTQEVMIAYIVMQGSVLVTEELFFWLILDSPNPYAKEKSPTVTGNNIG